MSRVGRCTPSTWRWSWAGTTDDIYSELGRLQWELLRAARLVVDTGLHHYRWSRQEAIDYYIDTVGATTALATQQIDLYLYYVGYFTAYKTGMMKILELRQHAMDELGDDFDIKEFHRAVLLHNCLPLPLLERLVEDYIEIKRAPRRAATETGRRKGGCRPGTLIRAQNRFNETTQRENPGVLFRANIRTQRPFEPVHHQAGDACPTTNLGPL